MNAPIAARDVVLLVDDTPANLAYLSDALDEAGYKVLVATDGHTAIDRLKLVTPDIILLDAVMPGMDGFDACKAIRGDVATHDIPVIFMTALIESEHIVRAFAAGATDYVTKPVRQDEVLARITSHVRRANTLRKAQRSIEVCGKAGVTADATGNITWQTPKARKWLHEYCGDDSSSHNWKRLRCWLLRDTSGANQTEINSHFSVTHAASRLTVHYAGEIDHGEHLLLLEEHRTEESAQRLCNSFNLTAREGEVLHWLAGGKTNRDIAEILGMSPRTVNKHLERIYVKLGVETRASATAMAVHSLSAPIVASTNA
jgi:DNA-binding NarL/FixJ family response regulator